ncbi:hypothetical protein C8F01DRAFT_1247991 [Mycena amicta]|nr:hypothetical protein C8F01DRAFT_1247991 [Mycena amicta]
MISCLRLLGNPRASRTPALQTHPSILHVSSILLRLSAFPPHTTSYHNSASSRTDLYRKQEDAGRGLCNNLDERGCLQSAQSRCLRLSRDVIPPSISPSLTPASSLSARYRPGYTYGESRAHASPTSLPRQPKYRWQLSSRRPDEVIGRSTHLPPTRPPRYQLLWPLQLDGAGAVAASGRSTYVPPTSPSRLEQLLLLRLRRGEPGDGCPCVAASE